MNQQIAILGGGCFWCLEGILKRVKGVDTVVSGYAGGSIENPTYEQVCSGNTGHAEVVEVTFDDEILSYTDLLTLFFALHDPTTLNRQGADVGSQYRSIILYRDDKQKQQADEIIAQLTQDKVFENPIVTELEPLTTFYRAEAGHQDYFDRNPSNGYCQAVIAPKIRSFFKQYPDIT